MNDEALFDRARVIKSDKDRTAFLDEACRDKPDLRRRVEALLAAYDHADSFFDEPLIAQSAEEYSTSMDKPGDTIGPYKLLQKIGEGGFGIVYLAEQQEPMIRQVAVKVIKPGMDSRQVMVRFSAERQTLAMMDHPNIAKVLDAGTTGSGRPYFVMELVKGTRITKFCDQQRLSPRARLELFIPVCRAIQHAHQKGIIHRDVKPSNVLVSLYDGEPVPKVIDFGVAKAIEQRLTDKTLFTQFGQVIGTLEYMSPEQAELNQLDVDTRSDIYSLGAVLYELLTGTPPFDRKMLGAAAFDEMLRIIREQEPVRPSKRLSSSQELISISMQRQTDPAKLTRMVHGELDWILMKSLEKQRARRYETASALADDLQRYLSNEPVAASPPSSAYRLRKLVSKNRRLFAIGLAFILVLVASAVVSTVLAIIANNQADIARTANQQVEAAQKQLKAQRDLAITDSHRATAARLAAQAENVRIQRPVRSVLLGIEAVNATKKRGLPILATAHAALLQSVNNLGGLPLRGHSHHVTAARMSPDDNWLATASRDATVLLWKLGDQASTSPIRLEAGKPVTLLEISADSRWIAGGCDDGSLRLWDLRAEDPIASRCTLSGHSGEVQTIRFSPDGRWLASVCDADKTVGLYDLSSGDPASSMSVLHKAVSTVVPLIVFGADGRWLFTGDGAKVVGYEGLYSAMIWDLTSADVASSGRNMPWHGSGTVVTGSPAGNWLITGADTLQRWDLASEAPWEPTTILSGLQEAASRTMSPDGRWLAFVSVTPEIRLRLQLCDLNAEDVAGSVVTLGEGPGSQFPYFGPSSRWLVVTLGEQPHVWDLHATDIRKSEKWLPPILFRADAKQISPDGRWLAMSTGTNEVRVFDLNEAKRSDTILRGHDVDFARPEAISSNSRWLVTAAGDAKRPEAVPRLWDLGKEWVVSSDFEIPLVVRVNANGRFPLAVASGQSRSPIIRRLDLSDPDPVGTSFAIDTRTPGYRYNSASLTLDGRWLLLTRVDNRGEVWDLASSPPSTKFEIDERGSYQISQSGRWLAATVFGNNDERQVRIWDLNSTDVRGSVQELPATVRTRVSGFSSTDQWLVLAQVPLNEFEFWDLTQRPPTPASQFAPPRRATASMLNKDGNWFVSCSAETGILLWDLGRETLARPLELRTETPIDRLLDISPDGRWLVTAEDKGGKSPFAVAVWDLSSPLSTSPAAQLVGHEDSISMARISDDGTKLVTASRDLSLRLWNLRSDRSSEPELVLSPYNEGIETIALTPNANRIVTVSASGRGTIWELDVDVLLESARKLAGRELSKEERKAYMID